MKKAAHPLASHLRHGLIALFLLHGAGMASAQAGNGQPMPPEAGIWFDDSGDGAVEIAPCGRNLLCGKIVWLKEPMNAEGRPKHDKYNPDPALQKRPICGLPILANLQRMTDGSYDLGTVYDPKKGSQHEAAIRLLRDDKLQLTGFGLGRLLSKNFVWTRAPADLPLCNGKSAAKPAPAQPAAASIVPPAAAAAAAPPKPKAAAPVATKP